MLAKKRMEKAPERERELRRRSPLSCNPITNRKAMLRRILTLCSASLALLIASNIASAQTAARLTQPIDEGARVTLRGNVPPMARAEFDRGAAPVSTPYTGMRLVLKRSPQQEAALSQLPQVAHARAIWQAVWSVG
jgi:hypothetical protein